jgi:hypothetical protein
MGRHKLRLEEIAQITNELFNDDWTSEKAARIIQAILEAQSPQDYGYYLCYGGDVRTSYKMIHRFLKDTDTKQALNRLYFEPTPFG